MTYDNRAHTYSESNHPDVKRVVRSSPRCVKFTCELNLCRSLLHKGASSMAHSPQLY